MKKVVIIFYLLCSSLLALGQQYKVTFNVPTISNYSFDGDTEVLAFYISNTTASKTEIVNQGTVVVNYKPSYLIIESIKIEVENQGDVKYNCYGSKTISLSGSQNECFSSSGSGSVSLNCSYVDPSWGKPGDPSYTYSIQVEPVIAFVTAPPSRNYCVNEAIQLKASPGFSTYNWKFRLPSGTWQNLNSVSGSSVSILPQDIFGTNFTASDFNKSFYITYTVGSGCNSNSQNAGTAGLYSFSSTPLQISSIVQRNISCNNFSDGSVTVTAFNRSFFTGENIVALYVYKQPNTLPVNFVTSSATTTINGLSVGTYYILVESDVIPCDALIFYGPITFTNPTAVILTPVVIAVSCYGDSNGSISLTGSGGTGTGYLYSKDSGANFQSSNTFNGLAQGSYMVRVKDSNNCLSATVSVPVSQPSSGITISPPDITRYNGSDLSCAGGSDGQVTLSGVTGGTPGYQYSKDGTNFQTVNVFNALSAGNYTFTVKDANSCIQTSSLVTLVAPPLITRSTSTVPTNCFSEANGKIIVTASGGTGSLSYSLNGTTFQSANEFASLAANNYIVTVKDINDCTVTQDATVTQPLELIASGNATTVKCFGGSDGSVTLAAVNGTGPYIYSFNGGSYNITNTFANLPANSYTISVKDSKDCIGNSFVNIPSNPPITGLITPTVISCNGGSNGSLNLTPSGGVIPYTYSWSNGITTEDLIGLPAGLYTVIVTDSKGCTNSNTISQSLVEPLPITVNYTTSDYNGKNINCFGSTNGSINITTSGGNAGYTYSWSNNSIAEDLTNLPAGTYTVTIKDSKNCPGSQTIILTQPSQLVTSLNAKQDLLCFGSNTGSIIVTTTGGTGTPSYSINSGANWQDSPSFSSLTASSYTVLTKDVNNCQANFTTNITAPTDIALSVNNITSTTCNQNNGSAIAATTGGIPSYHYEWFNSSNASIGTTATINNLGAGIYKVIVTDQNACTKQELVPINSSNGPQLTEGAITPATCSDTADGTASISITGGSSPYTILWPNGQITTTATNLEGGEYIVQVKDNTNCLALKTITIDSPPELIINTLSKTDPNCNGNSDGSITLEATGGNGIYSYDWNTGATTPALTNLAAGTYTITVRDIKNCTQAEQITLTDPPVFTIDLGVDKKICEGMTVPLTVTEDNATYNWTSDNGFISSSQNVQLTQAGIYTLTVINSNGCEATDDFQLTFDTNLLKADFLMTSEAHAGDTIVLIDISWPMPETVTWTYDEGATIIEETADFSIVRFDDPGDYDINLLARLAQCSNRNEQTITILEAVSDEETTGRQSERLIEKVSAYPNPSSDEVSVSIELSKNKFVSLELYQAEINKRIFQESLTAEKAHIKAINLSTLPRGMYILYIRAGKEIRTVKIIKK